MPDTAARDHLQAFRAAVLAEAADHLAAWGEDGHLHLAMDGDGLPLHRSPFFMPEDADTAADLLRRLAAVPAPTTPDDKEN